MRRIGYLILLCSWSCLAQQNTPQQDWLEFKQQLAEQAAGPVGMYAIQHVLDISAGETAYLPSGGQTGELRWAKNTAALALAQVAYADNRAVLSGPGIGTVDLLQSKPSWRSLPNGLNVRASVLNGTVLKVWLYNPKLIEQRGFKELSFFPYDSRGVVTATFHSSDPPVAVSYVDSRQRAGTMYVVGTLRLQIAGKPYDLKAYSYEKTWDRIGLLLLLLKDRTSGKTTYEGGRVVDISIPKGAPPRTVTVNFNTAYSFLCAHSEYYNCPLVLTNNLDTELSYGEKHPPLTTAAAISSAGSR
jgi:hypothetical protein